MKEHFRLLHFAPNLCRVFAHYSLKFKIEQYTIHFL